MAIDYARLYARPKNYLIGKNLPEDEQLTVPIYSLAGDEFALADFSEEQKLNDPSLSSEEHDAIVKRVLQRKHELIATMLRIDIAEVKKFGGEYFEDLLVACMERMATNADKEKVARLKKKVDEVKTE